MMPDEAMIGNGQAPETTAARTYTILNVDDNPAGRYAVSRLLKANGFTVIEAGTGHEALMAAGERPDLVVLDVNLPDISGLEVCRRLKSDPLTADVIVLQLSATAVGLEERLQGLETGADSYLVHPIEPMELVANIRALLRLRQAEDKVRAAAQQWHSTFHAIGEGVLVFDTDGCVTRCNTALAKWLGQPEEALVGRQADEVLPAMPGGAAPPESSPAVEINGRWYQVTVHPIAGYAGQSQGGVAVLTDITERQQSHALLEDRVRERTAELQRSQEELRRLSQHLQEAREEERTRISREIHDELGGALTSLKLELARLQRAADQTGMDEEHLQRFAELGNSIEATLDAVRRIAADLRPSILDHFGLAAAIEWQLTRLGDSSGLSWHFTPPEGEPALPRDHATAVFRIFQETLTNVARHAGASRVDVRLETRPGELLLEVRDDGRGISEAQRRGAQSLGLLGMRERVRLLQGDLSIEGRPGQGTTVRVRLPLTEG
jgi:signal transduction histidine kinase